MIRESRVSGLHASLVNLTMIFLNRASHTKASLIGSSISIPITDGQLNLGTWQGADTTSRTCEPALIRFYWYRLLGIYLTEFRHAAHTRRVIATIL